jgi:hypothetical protein
MNIGLADNRCQKSGISPEAVAETRLKELDSRSIDKNLCQVMWKDADLEQKLRKNSVYLFR